MRRRSRSVPRDAHEREQIVGLSHAHKTLTQVRPLQHLGRAETSLGQTTLRGESAELRSQQTFLIH